ncbi:C-C motif chemokine 20-like [Leucoraja erinacea]|uniref:C-C motif chemokine 20-like n=1 Tax=Leucoraja erinaceus TaxID=7782 RepID=UPI002455558A|nr:C-C motif chemokine 20-like [Leucoraja erinacea]
MNTLKRLLPAAMLSLIVLNMFGNTLSAAAYRDCCLAYSRKRLPQKLISGYVEQKSNEVCEIDAIIFYTIRGRAVCADPEHHWVKKALNILSKKLRKMSQD